MLTASVALKNYLASATEHIYADLFTITTTAGTVLRYTTADRKVDMGGGVVYYPSGPQLEAAGISTKLGLSVSNLDITIKAAPTDIAVFGLNLLAAIRAGFLDGASFKMHRLFMPTWGDVSLGVILKFQGTIAPSSVGRTSAQTTVKSDTEKLNVMLPRRVIQPSCLNVWADAGCGLLKASFTSASSVTAVTGSKTISCGLAQATGYFDLGRLTFTSGPNVGLTFTVKTYVTGSVEFPVPPPFTPVVGNTFTIVPGCDKKQATCNTKFSNLGNFAGFPFVPTPETAL